MAAFANEDAALAVLQDAAKKAGILEESVFIMTADHGGHDKTHGSNSPEDMTIPWIVSGKGVKAGFVITVPVTTIRPRPHFGCSVFRYPAIGMANPLPRRSPKTIQGRSMNTGTRSGQGPSMWGHKRSVHSKEVKGACDRCRRLLARVKYKNRPLRISRWSV